MQRTGSNWIAGRQSSSKHGKIFGANPLLSGKAVGPAYCEATSAEISEAFAAAEKAFTAFPSISDAVRADALDAIAQAIEAAGPQGLWEVWREETGYPEARVQGETARTCFQLRLCAKQARTNSWRDIRIDRGDPNRAAPGPKPDTRSMWVPLGPVVSFPASNFVGAFGAAGVDFGPAFAAGCPVVVKAHPKNPGSSDLFAQCIYQGFQKAGVPAGFFSLLNGVTAETSRAVVQHPATAAVGFTGSLRGGRAIYDFAGGRPNPIPVFTEMGSSNPVFILPQAAAEQAETLAKGAASSVVLGSGQFCTNPGNLFVLESNNAGFESLAIAQFKSMQPTAMVHRDILEAYDARCDFLLGSKGVSLLAESDVAADFGQTHARPRLFGGAVRSILEDDGLLDEDFGPCTKLFAGSREELLEVARLLPGQLTATVFGAGSDFSDFADLLDILARKVGRLSFNNWPTGVEVNDSMVHGGPWPACSVPSATSVGTRSIFRFARPICYQNAPQESLPELLRDKPVAGLLRMIDGAWTAEAV